MKTGNDDQLRQELRLAQLEIRMLREQLLKAVQDAQRSRDQSEEPAKPGRPSIRESVIVPMVPNEAESLTGPNRAPANGKPRVLYVEDSEPNFRLVENVLRGPPRDRFDLGRDGPEGPRDGAQPKSAARPARSRPSRHPRQQSPPSSLQAQPETAKIPVIVISADATPSQIERMLDGRRPKLSDKAIRDSSLPLHVRRNFCSAPDETARRDLYLPSPPVALMVGT